MPIQSFADKQSAALYIGLHVRGLEGRWVQVARGKLAMLNQAQTLADLLVPPGNRLEKLAGNRAGQYSIRINDQWRICFVWTVQGPQDVQVVDYH